MLHASIPSLPPLPSPDAERRRVAAHIERAETAARAADVGSLDRLTRMVRSLLLDELARYRAQGVFPQNPDFAEPTPYFIDAAGTPCAMAHLLAVGGEGALVERIARERNNAWVRELADEPRLIAWLAAAGITVGEAAMIQPTYCSTQAQCVCDEGFQYVPHLTNADGVLEGTVLSMQDNFVATIRIDAIHGDVGAFAIGDTMTATLDSGAVGSIALVPVTVDESLTDSDGFRGISLNDDGEYESINCSTSRPIEKALFIEAMTSGDCIGTLEAADSHWDNSTCFGGGCSVGADGAPSTLGVLCAVVAALVWRRVRKS